MPLDAGHFVTSMHRKRNVAGSCPWSVPQYRRTESQRDGRARYMIRRLALSVQSRAKDKYRKVECISWIACEVQALQGSLYGLSPFDITSKCTKRRTAITTL